MIFAQAYSLDTAVTQKRISCEWADKRNLQPIRNYNLFRLISVFQTTAMLKFVNSQHYPPAPFA